MMNQSMKYEDRARSKINEDLSQFINKIVSKAKPKEGVSSTAVIERTKSFRKTTSINPN
jgi:hypothetical protein